MPDVIIEKLTERHLGAVRDIYNYYAENTTATWHAHALTDEEMRPLVFSDDEQYGAFAVLDGDDVVGYVTLKPFKPRDAYAGTAEISVYIKPTALGRGLGQRALTYIEAYAQERAFHVLIAAISGDNAASIALFERNGYEKSAHLKQVGYKFGKRLDAVMYQKIID